MDRIVAKIGSFKNGFDRLLSCLNERRRGVRRHCMCGGKQNKGRTANSAATVVFAKETEWNKWLFATAKDPASTAAYR